jgi:hypothetical protein
MVGSALLGAWIAHAAFWIVIAIAAAQARYRLTAIFFSLWLIGYAAARSAEFGAAWFMPYVAALDIALVLIVFKGDIRLT